MRWVGRAWELLHTRDLRGPALADALQVPDAELARDVAAVVTEFYLDRG